MRRTKVHVSFLFFNFWLVRSPELCSAAQPNSSLVSFIRLKPRIYLAEKFEQLNRCETQLNSNELNSEEIRFLGTEKAKFIIFSYIKTSIYL